MTGGWRWTVEGITERGKHGKVWDPERQCWFAVENITRDGNRVWYTLPGTETVVCRYWRSDLRMWVDRPHEPYESLAEVERRCKVAQEILELEKLYNLPESAGAAGSGSEDGRT